MDESVVQNPSCSLELTLCLEFHTVGGDPKVPVSSVRNPHRHRPGVRAEMHNDGLVGFGQEPVDRPGYGGKHPG
jgi:hypothetical protein